MRRIDRHVDENDCKRAVHQMKTLHDLIKAYDIHLERNDQSRKEKRKRRIPHFVFVLARAYPAMEAKITIKKTAVAVINNVFPNALGNCIFCHAVT